MFNFIRNSPLDKKKARVRNRNALLRNEITDTTRLLVETFYLANILRIYSDGTLNPLKRSVPHQISDKHFVNILATQKSVDSTDLRKYLTTLIKIPGETDDPDQSRAAVEELLARGDSVVIKDKNNTLYRIPTNSIIHFINMRSTCLWDPSKQDLTINLSELAEKYCKGKNSPVSPKKLSERIFAAKRTLLELNSRTYTGSIGLEAIKALKSSEYTIVTMYQIYLLMCINHVPDPLKTYQAMFNYFIKNQHGVVALIALFHAPLSAVHDMYCVQFTNIMITYPEFVYMLSERKYTPRDPNDDDFVIEINDTKRISEVAIRILCSMYSMPMYLKKVDLFFNTIFVSNILTFYFSHRHLPLTAVDIAGRHVFECTHEENITRGLQAFEYTHFFHFLPFKISSSAVPRHIRYHTMQSILSSITRYFDEGAFIEFRDSFIYNVFGRYDTLALVVSTGNAALLQMYLAYFDISHTPLETIRNAYETAIEYCKPDCLEVIIGLMPSREAIMQLIAPHRFGIPRLTAFEILLEADANEELSIPVRDMLAVAQILLNYGAELITPQFNAIEEAAKKNMIELFILFLSYAASVIDRCELFLLFRTIDMQSVKKIIDNLKTARKDIEKAERFAMILRTLDSMTKRCRYCGNACSKRCSRCKVAFYCSNECHESDWINHSKMCETYRRRLEELNRKFVSSE